MTCQETDCTRGLGENNSTGFCRKHWQRQIAHQGKRTDDVSAALFIKYAEERAAKLLADEPNTMGHTSVDYQQPYTPQFK